MLVGKFSVIYYCSVGMVIVKIDFMLIFFVDGMFSWLGCCGVVFDLIEEFEDEFGEFFVFLSFVDLLVVELVLLL